MSIRSFIAIPIPKEAANQLGDHAAKMSYQDKSGAVRWVDQENYHITLAFLGDQREHDLETLAEQLDYQISLPEFQLLISHLSAFPETKPKLLAAMVQKTEEIISLHQQVNSSIKSSNIVIEKRKFYPHVTLGRYRHSRNTYAGTIPMNISFNTLIEEVVLYQSILTSSGAEYEPIYRFPLEEFEIDYEEQPASVEDNLGEYLLDEG